MNKNGLKVLGQGRQRRRQDAPKRTLGQCRGLTSKNLYAREKITEMGPGDNHARFIQREENPVVAPQLQMLSSATLGLAKGNPGQRKWRNEDSPGISHRKNESDNNGNNELIK